MANVGGIRQETQNALNILDPAAGSGRLLVAVHKQSQRSHNYFGIDLSPVCVKMATVNLFLNGMKGEIMQANALAVDDFRISYKTRVFPLGIWKVEEKEKSELWYRHKNLFNTKPKDGQQLQLF